MPSLFRRLLVLFYALRFGARLVWLAAPADNKVHWIITLIQRVHASERGRSGLHGMLPLLGPLAGGFAQTLSTRPELAAGTLHDALDSVSHLLEPLPPEAAGHALAAAFGRPLPTLFESIDLAAVESGFAHQVHLARLARPIDGHRDVEIKLLRVKQRTQIADEAALLRWAARWLEKLSRAARQLRVRELAETFTQEIMRRLDLRTEAANQSQTAHLFADDSRVAVPAVIWDLCGDAVLVIEHIDTVRATDFAGLAAHRVSVPALAARIVEVITHEAFEHGFFHAALDARRIRVSIDDQTHGKLVLGDFAVMSNLSTQERSFFVHGATALFGQEYGRLADLHRNAGHVPQHARTEKIEAELRTRAEAHFVGASDERKAGPLFHHLLHAVAPFDGCVPPRLVAAQRAFEQAEALANALHPGVDSWGIARRMLADLARREFDHRGWAKHLAQELPHLAHLMPRVPQLAIRYLQHRHSVATARQHAQLVGEVTREYRRTRTLLWACTICGALLGALAILLMV
ncbi:ABC1 kinase family protein [Paraburkholderia rhizosphaerae]|uniref:Ubiquinone biosynthesis protein n=1 Tax=Paraburkholderia rhizosphaerae TaxID=480658 RepID=A0A4R8L6M1_9BURK|nr:AarF/UbiB family protein [Paraburkholderia rhizosphaerae]TDY38273.1 ubiquinone biosynthesis protein [Paraburkholderia rhizosphaerae]